MTERPRDALGRPLAPDADAALIVPGVPADAGATDGTAWSLAMGYLDDGRPFHAHEVFEARWRTCPAADRPAWRSLAQWGAALTHAARGNDVGARRLADRARDGLAEAARVPECIDVERVLASCDALAPR